MDRLERERELRELCREPLRDLLRQLEEIVEKETMRGGGYRGRD